jgi:MYXO-CTERM domain-containing protein
MGPAVLVSSRTAVALAALAVAFASATVRAEQVVVFDQTWVHTPDLPDSHFRMPPGDDAPSDWTSPIDYSQGSAWVYLEVHTKPTEQETKFQVCFEATPTYACTLQSPTYTDVGTYEWESTFDQFWSPPGELVDWTMGVNDIACILKDTMNGKPSADNVGPEVAALYTPTEVRLVVTLVEAGSVYEPPTPTGETTGTEGDSGGSSGDGDTAGATTSGGADETSASATAADDAPADDDGSVSASASATGPASATDASESSDTGAGVDDDDGGGCSCTAGRDDASTLGLFALVLVGVRSRRRRITADARR